MAISGFRIISVENCYYDYVKKSWDDGSVNDSRSNAAAKHLFKNLIEKTGLICWVMCLKLRITNRRLSLLFTVNAFIVIISFQHINLLK